MFNFITYESTAPANHTSAGAHIFELKLEDNDADYVLNRNYIWEDFRGDVFVFKMGNTVISIPSSMYIIIGDEMGVVDWIQVDELIDREIDVVVLDREFSGWRLEKLELIDHKTSQHYALPRTSNALPITDDGKNCIVMSKRDQQSTLECTIDMITVI